MYFEKILNGDNINNNNPRLKVVQVKKFLDFKWK